MGKITARRKTTRKRRKAVNGARAIMASRKQPKNSRDFFPTPPFATRALCEHVMPRAGFAGKRFRTVWEPACGEGHMAEVLREYADRVFSSDIFDYGYGYIEDFLKCPDIGADWIITNPPFGDKSEPFILRALALANVGVAMFLRSQWLESIGRYQRIFQPHPPRLIAQFAERVPLHAGCWKPTGSTATAYLWIVWTTQKSKSTEFMWIPPGCRQTLTRLDDGECFTAHPVITKQYQRAADQPHHPGSVAPEPAPNERPPGHGAGSPLSGVA